MAMTYNFTAITAGQVDADSIINQVLTDAIRGDIYHLKEFCYGIAGAAPYAPDAKHDHDGVNSALVTDIADGAVSTSAKIAAGVVKAGHIARGTGNQGFGTIGAGLAVQFQLSADCVYYTVHSTDANREQLRIVGASGVDYRFLAIKNLHGGGIATVVYFNVFTASKDRIVIYYDERTGEIVGCWQSRQKDMPSVVDGKPGEVIIFDERDPKFEFIRRLDLKDDHPFVVNRTKENEKAFRMKGVGLAQMIAETYIVNSKELKTKPKGWRPILK